MAVVVQCPNCEKKLKLNEPTPGKRVRCPGCKEPFVPVSAKKKKKSASGAPKRKRPKPVDDFDDYGSDGDDLYGDDNVDDDYQEPARPRRSGGKKGSKKKAPAKKSKAPLIIGVSILGVALAGGLTYMLWPDSGSSDANAGDAATDPTAGTVAANAGGAAAGSHDAAGGSGAPANPGPSVDEVDSGMAKGRAEPVPTTMTQGNTYDTQNSAVSLAWLPAQSEAVVQIDVGRLLGGPLKQALAMADAQISDFRSRTGFGPEDIQTVTLGVGGISDAIASGREPKPDQLPAVVVVRARSAIDSAKIQAVLPMAKSVTEGQMTYLRVPADPPVALWFADSTTVVVGGENWVKQVAANTSPPTGVDTALFDGTSAIQVVFSPSNSAIFQQFSNAPLPPGPPASMQFIKTFLGTAKGASVGIDFTNDLGFSMGTRCADSAGAQQLVAAMKASMEEGKAQSAAQAQQMPPMLAPLMNINKALMESLKIEANGDICKMTMSAPGAGQQLGAFIPMIPLMLGPAIQQAQSAARRTQSSNNLKQIILAMHNFNDVYQRFPNAAGMSESGEKWLSWRVHLLPFLGHEDLYKQFVLEEPWDSPTNRPLVEQMPDVYKSPKATLAPGTTLYQVPVGPGTAFEDSKGHALTSFTDGSSTTFLILEVSPERAVIWTQPEDYVFNPANPRDGLGGVEPNGFQAAFADGRVKVIEMSTDNNNVKGMFTRNGGEPVQGAF